MEKGIGLSEGQPAYAKVSVDDIESSDTTNLASTSVSTTPDSRKPFRNDVQSIRGIAVAAVVLFHVFPLYFPLGLLGVDAFFVVSGFVVTRVCSVDSNFSAVGFWGNRFARLGPSSTLVVVVTVALSAVVFSPSIASDFALDGLWAGGFAANIRFYMSGKQYSAGSTVESPFMHFWSLAVEEQFYALFPLWLCVPGRFRQLVMVGLVAVSLVSACVVSGEDEMASFYMLPTRLWQLGLGCCAALREPFDVPTWIEWSSLAGFVLVILSPIAPEHTFSIGSSLAVSICVFVMCVGPDDGPAQKFLGSVSALAWLGDVSYTVYLVHWPLLVLYGSVSESMGKLAWFACTLLFSGIVWGTQFEKSFRKSTKRKIRLGFLLTATSMGTGLIMHLVCLARIPGAVSIGDASPSLSALREAIYNATTLRGPILRSRPEIGATYVSNILPHYSPFHFPLNPIFTRPNATTVMMIGDSHMLTFIESVRVLCQQRGYNFFIYWLGHCSIPSNDGSHCERLTEFALQWARYSAYNRVLVTGGMWTDVHDFANLEVFSRSVTEAGTLHVRIVDFPCHQRYNLARISRVYQSATPSTEYEHYVANMEKVAYGYTVQTRDLFCFNALCPVIVDDVLVIADGHHTSLEYAHYIKQGGAEFLRMQPIPWPT